MGRRSSDRPLPEGDRPPLLLKPFMNEVDALARASGIGPYRVAYKRNARGEHVIAVILLSST